MTIGRGGSATLGDGTRIDFVDFLPHFSLAGGQPTTLSGDYVNPAALLNVTPPASERKRAFAFTTELPTGAPIGAPVGGYKYQMVDFEKVPDAHVLSVQKDPGASIFYLGGALLVLTLSAVFFFSHERVWALVEEQPEGGYGVLLGGNTNRNRIALEDRFKRLTNAISGQPNEVTHE